MIFVTLEDETGTANIVVFKDVARRQRRLLLGSRLLGVAGQLQVRGEGEHRVVHLLAKRLFDHSELSVCWTSAAGTSIRTRAHALQRKPRRPALLSIIGSVFSIHP